MASVTAECNVDLLYVFAIRISFPKKVARMGTGETVQTILSF